MIKCPEFQVQNVDIKTSQVEDNLSRISFDEKTDQTILETNVELNEEIKSNIYIKAKRSIRLIIKWCWSLLISFLYLFRFDKNKTGDINQLRIVQCVPTLIKGDAIGNDVEEIAKELDRLNYRNIIVTINTLKTNHNKVVPLLNYWPKKDDIIIYHMCIGTPLSKFVKKAKVARKIMLYHNITPSKYFLNNHHAFMAAKRGREELAALKDYIDVAYGDSSYNKQELDSLNYKNTGVLPVFYLDNDLKEIEIDYLTKEKYDDGLTNIFFVGRISFNKCYEDIIKTFYIYHKYFNPTSRLILVGKEVDPAYKMFIDTLIEKADMKESVFLEHQIHLQELAAIYTCGNLFLCESEHEGFCVPLLEAMHFNKIILAYNSSAIPDTLGDAGALFNCKNHYYIASLMDLLLKDKAIEKTMLMHGKKRLNYFSYKNVAKQFDEFADKYFKID